MAGGFRQLAAEATRGDADVGEPQAMKGIVALPDFALRPSGDIGGRFVSSGLRGYQSAARHVQGLPYGRNSDRACYRLVLAERRGTCSTKHALLAALALEHGEYVDILLGIYEMDEENTPGIDEVLRQYGLTSVPEAHCYLAYRGNRVDLTREDESTGAVVNFPREECIAPDQIGAYNVEKHRSFVPEWAAACGLEFEYVWQAREECIETLAKPDENLM